MEWASRSVPLQHSERLKERGTPDVHIDDTRFNKAVWTRGLRCVPYHHVWLSRKHNEDEDSTHKRYIWLPKRHNAVARSQLIAVDFPSLGNPPSSASRVTGTGGLHHHTQLMFCIFVETGFHLVAQAGLKLLCSSENNQNLGGSGIQKSTSLTGSLGESNAHKI
ncbi:60S ribosomal protein L31 [Plecturocebus cupreus]